MAAIEIIASFIAFAVVALSWLVLPSQPAPVAVKSGASEASLPTAA
jgi:hypothetical protein